MGLTQIKAGIRDYIHCLMCNVIIFDYPLQHRIIKTDQIKLGVDE